MAGILLAQSWNGLELDTEGLTRLGAYLQKVYNGLGVVCSRFGMARVLWGTEGVGSA